MKSYIAAESVHDRTDIAAQYTAGHTRLELKSCWQVHSDCNATATQQHSSVRCRSCMPPDGAGAATPKAGLVGRNACQMFTVGGGLAQAVGHVGVALAGAALHLPRQHQHHPAAPAPHQRPEVRCRVRQRRLRPPNNTSGCGGARSKPQ